MSETGPERREPLPPEAAGGEDATVIRRAIRGDEELAGASQQPIADRSVLQPEESSEPTAADKTVISKAPVIDVPSGKGAPAEIAQVLIGRQLGHFHLEELIGGGGMGAVFRARDERLDRTVAVKVIPRVGDDPDLLRRFRNEAQSAARLDHPHIARVYDVGQQDGWHYIVFEFIQGTNVRDSVNRNGILSIDDAVFYTRQVAEALQHAWRRGVVHRDVKPSNVLVTSDGQVKLVDMGLARSQQLEVSEDMTASGVTLGTFDYISPEQARDPREADVRSDLYSLGCTLYFMLTGRPPFPGGTMLQKLLSHGGAPPPDPRGFRAEVSSDLYAILRKLLSKQPEDRYQEPVDLIADLYELASREKLVRSHSGGTVAVRQGPVWLQRLEYHLPWVAAFGMLIVSIAVVQAFPSPGVEIPQPPPGQTDLVSIAPTASLGSQPDRTTSLEEAVSAENSRAAATGIETGNSASNAAENAADPPPEVGPAPAPSKGVPFAIPLPGGASLSPDFPASSPPQEALETRGVIVGGDAAEAGEPGWVHAQTLSDALQYAAKHESVEEIELRSRIVHTGPVRIPRDGLLIRSAPGVHSEIRFDSEDLLAMERLVMVRLDGHRLKMQGVHLVWKAPVNVFDGGTLFGLAGGENLALRDCTITIDNSSRRDAIYAVDLRTDVPSTGGQPENSSPPLVVVDLQNCIVRGQMTFMAMDLAAPLQIRWVNGLLAINRAMLDTAGAASQSAPGELHEIELEMEHVTAYTPEGLVRVRLGPSGSEPVLIRRDCKDCVFVAQAGVPLVSISRLGSLDEASSCLEFRGLGNAYDTADGRTEWLYKVSDSEGQSRTWHFMDREGAEWFYESNPSGNVRWAGPFPVDNPTHAHRPEEYQQEGEIVPGFIAERLPLLPVSGIGSAQEI